MKRQVRNNTFETNSSSVHSITMCSIDEYKKWKNGEIFYDYWNNCFISKDEIIAEAINDNDYKGSLSDFNEMFDFCNKDNSLYTEQEFFNNYYDYEHFYKEYTTKNGDTVVAFGYYGEDR